MTPTTNNATRTENSKRNHGIAVHRTPDGGFVLQDVQPHGPVRELGTFQRPEEAWRVLDVLDTEGL